MYNIGIIGSESSHVEAYTSICNLPGEDGKSKIPDFHVNAICGIDADKERTKAVVSECKIDKICNSPDELLDICDAVMIMMRKGDDRVKTALPFIERGIPVFLDKPVCMNKEEITTLKDCVSKHSTYIFGGSNCRNNENIREIKNLISAGEFGEISGISLNHSADINSPFGGIRFYIPHGIETIISLVDKMPLWVETIVYDNRNFTAKFGYENMYVDLLLTQGVTKRFVNVFGSKRTDSFWINTANDFYTLFKEFTDGVREKRVSNVKDIERLTNNILIIEAIEKSIEENKRISF